jgi:hypothetical protein
MVPRKLKTNVIRVTDDTRSRPKPRYFPAILVEKRFIGARAFIRTNMHHYENEKLGVKLF